MNSIKIKNQHAPILSIIIPAYNSSKTIAKCIESVIKQSFGDWEIIIVDDGSTDDLKSALGNYTNDSRISYNLTQHKGCSAARNYGISLAKGKFILFCDADDEYLDNALATLSALLSDKIDIIVFGAAINNHSRDFRHDDIVPDEIDCMDKKSIMHALFYENGARPYVWNSCYKTEFIKFNKIDFSTNVVLGEDQIFQFNAFTSADRVKFVSAKLYLHNFGNRYSVNNFYLENPEKRMSQHIKIVQEIHLIFRQKNIEAGYDFAKWVIDFLFADFMTLTKDQRRNLTPDCRKLLYDCKIKEKLPNKKDRIKCDILPSTLLQNCYIALRK